MVFYHAHPFNNITTDDLSNKVRKTFLLPAAGAQILCAKLKSGSRPCHDQLEIKLINLVKPIK